MTCYSGYGAGGAADDQKSLRRHLVCVNADDGKIVWSKAVAPVLPEDSFRGFLSQHGYASHTPASDGERIYCFFGKTGVVAFDLDGKQLWQTSVGTGSATSGWGTGASLIVHQDMVIVNASAESGSVWALNKKTGKEVWKAADVRNTWCTPAVVQTREGKPELVITVPHEVWGFDPATGKKLWSAEVGVGEFPIPGVVTEKDVAFVAGGRGKGGGSVAAVRVGGRGDVTNTHVLWKSSEYSPVPTPVLVDGKLYCLNDSGFAFCVDAATGKQVYRERPLGGGAGGNRSTYASMVAANGKLYALSRTAGTYVIACRGEYEQIARNSFASDKTDFNGTPAISNGRLFLRSNTHLYCVQASK
ncbi:MAG: PQQ-binding-like beta-propeller repeat protein [Planctomycetia bacterium]|nr:PQQ-binding-like beta-propeller repeat protein [Planctomycetia bacterium]